MALYKKKMTKVIDEAEKQAKILNTIAARNEARKAASKPKPRKPKKESIVDKVARKALELYYKPKKKFKPSYGKYAKQGLTGEQIKRFKGK